MIAALVLMGGLPKSAPAAAQDPPPAAAPELAAPGAPRVPLPGPLGVPPGPWPAPPLPTAEAPAESAFFYHGRHYGSEALVHPLRMIVNGSFGILQLDNRDNHLGRIDYRNGVENVWMNVRNPVTAIRADGWRDFLLREVLPIGSSVKDARYWPNYTQHLIGGGMSYRMFAEWYQQHGLTHPRAWSAATMAVYHLLNEVVENDRFVGYTTDPVADLLIFDPGGMLLFNSDRVAGFFSHTLHMADWSYQPAYDPIHHTLENNGQNFALKLGLPWSKRWSLFHHYGTHGELGFSYTRPDGQCFSFAAGLKAANLIDLAPGTRTVDLVGTAGLFYDRDNSLLASLLVAQTKDYSVRLNLYPGLIHMGPVTPSLFVALDRQRQVLTGVSFGTRPKLPVGLGMSF